MIELFQLEFMQRAFIAGIILAPLLSMLGSFTTLRKMSFFADGIAHASLFGVALALMVGMAPFKGALIIGLIFGVVVFLLERYTDIASDAVIGILFTTGLALGIILISLQPGYQPDLISFLFGNILSVTWGDVWLIAGLSLLIITTLLFFFRQFTLMSLSEDLAWTSGINTKYLNLVFYILLSLSVVLGVKLLGIILVSALLITPAVTAKLVTKSFRTYVFGSVGCSLVAFIGGLFVSYYFDLPSGASIVLVATIIFVLILIMTSFQKLSSY
jgi:zinc transport system permease protein